MYSPPTLICRRSTLYNSLIRPIGSSISLAPVQHCNHYKFDLYKVSQNRKLGKGNSEVSRPSAYDILSNKPALKHGDASSLELMTLTCSKAFGTAGTGFCGTSCPTVGSGFRGTNRPIAVPVFCGSNRPMVGSSFCETNCLTGGTELCSINVLRSDDCMVCRK